MLKRNTILKCYHLNILQIWPKVSNIMLDNTISLSPGTRLLIIKHTRQIKWIENNNRFRLPRRKIVNTSIGLWYVLCMTDKTAKRIKTIIPLCGSITHNIIIALASPDRYVQFLTITPLPLPLLSIFSGRSIN